MAEIRPEVARLIAYLNVAEYTFAKLCEHLPSESQALALAHKTYEDIFTISLVTEERWTLRKEPAEADSRTTDTAKLP